MTDLQELVDNVIRANTDDFVELCRIGGIDVRTELKGADLAGCNLANADLRGADLRDADLRGADLQKADLRGADLRLADLRGAQLTGARFQGCLKDGARFDATDPFRVLVTYLAADLMFGAVSLPLCWGLLLLTRWLATDGFVARVMPSIHGLAITVTVASVIGFVLYDVYRFLARRDDGIPQAFWALTRPRLIMGQVLVIISATAVMSFWPEYLTGSVHNEQYSTRVGEHQSVTLADGSVVDLNTDTSIKSHTSWQGVSIRLLQGEVLVNVAHNHEPPMTVTAGDVSIQLVGATRFSVRLREAGAVETVVTKGCVLIMLHGERWQVSASQSALARADAINISQLAPAELARRLAWQDGLVVFSGQGLEEAVSEINRYTLTKLVVDDESPRMQTLRVTGRFPVKDPETFVKILETWGVRSRRERDVTGTEKIHLYAAVTDSRQ